MNRTTTPALSVRLSPSLLSLAAVVAPPATPPIINTLSDSPLAFLIKEYRTIGPFHFLVFFKLLIT